jgi:hypothetical protein
MKKSKKIIKPATSLNIETDSPPMPIQFWNHGFNSIVGWVIRDETNSNSY